MDIEVDLFGGVKIKLPEDEAKKVIAARDANKDELRKINEQLGALTQEKTAAEQKAAQAERDKAAAEAMKAGDITALKEIHTSELKAKEAKISGKLRDKALQALIGGNKLIVPGAVEDITEQLRARTAYNFDSDSLTVLDAAGQPLKDGSGNPLGADAFVGSWLEKRPHYLLDGTPPGSGAEGGGKPGNQPGKMTTAEYEASQRDPARAQAVAAKVAKREIVVVD